MVLRSTVLLIFITLIGSARPVTGIEPVSFRRDIAPVLQGRCLACHGPDQAEGGYRVDTFQHLMKPGDSGLASFTPQDLEESETFRRVVSEDDSERMPLDAAPLSSKQIALLRRWTEEGAKFDGSDPNAALASLVPAVVHADPPNVYTTTVPIMALAFAPTGDALIAGGYRELTVWDPVNGQLLRRIGNVAERTYAISASPDGRLLAVACGVPGQLGEVRMFSWPEGVLIRVFGGTRDVCLDVAFSPDGRCVATASADGWIRFFQVNDGALKHEIPAHSDWVTSLNFNRDGSRLASASRDKSAKVFDVDSGEPLVTYSGHGQPVQGVVFHPEGQSVYSSGADRKIHLWMVNDGKKVAEIIGFAGEIYRLQTGNDSLFAASADRSVRQYDIRSRKRIRSFSGLSDWALASAYHARQQWLAAGCFDGQVRIWSLENGSEICRIIAAPGYQAP
jgi:hypothetical protein